MPIIQISKIQVRRGTEIELPGAPSSLDPLTFTPSLDAAEFGFATDTGRLFIGHDPGEGNPNFERTEFPYQNIEVLTENSRQAIKRIIDVHLKDQDRGGFATAPLANASPDDWDTVVLDGPAPRIIRFDTDMMSTRLDYFVFRTTGEPVRHGTMTIFHDGGAAEPALMDNSMGVRAASASLDPNDVFEALRFRIAARTDDGVYFALQYQNRTGSPLVAFIRSTRVSP